MKDGTANREEAKPERDGRAVDGTEKPDVLALLDEVTQYECDITEPSDCGKFYEVEKCKMDAIRAEVENLISRVRETQKLIFEHSACVNDDGDIDEIGCSLWIDLRRVVGGPEFQERNTGDGE